MANYARDIVIFGNHYRDLYSAEERHGQSEGGWLLNPSERSFIRQQATGDGSHIVTECQKRLDLGIQYYYGIRNQITSILHTWDAVIAEKNRSDEAGWQAPSREFLHAFHICLYLIPQRVRVGLLGPFESVEGVNASYNYDIHSASDTEKRSSNSGNTTTACNDVNDDLPDYEDFAESSQRTQAGDVEDSEILALTPSDVFTQWDCTQWDCSQWDCISIPSGNSDQLSLNEDKDDDDDELPPREEGTSEPSRGRFTRPWQRFLRENEPVGLGQAQLNRESSGLGSAVPSKRKAAYDEEEHDYEEPASGNVEKSRKLRRKAM
ncbi:uncharacterized protein C8A04DRAFT_33429 [Dichotomopilus funicola]|uniref:Uncharacterized protein n=1 Tax=Dichotomopilus funicola TaxID=1934379 RepID=A0AAN6UU84_9PEZI|nr:hypothetical protein C8A04DRAFT_33429 [Dichotomopilus funicola]